MPSSRPARNAARNAAADAAPDAAPHAAHAGGGDAAPARRASAGSGRTAGAASAGSPGRGRTARLTRQLIIEATAKLLRDDPGAAPTMARVARAVGASPMALYRHFSDRDDLLLAVARHVLSSQGTRLPEHATWQEELRAWMLENYRQARAYPQLMQHALNGDATVWLGDAAVLVAILERAGIPPPQLAAALSWTATTTLGHCLVAASAPPQLPSGRLYAALADLHEEDATRLAPVILALPRTPAEAFDVAIDATIASLARFTAG